MEKKSQLNRREFIAKGAALTTAGTHIINAKKVMAARVGASPSGRPYVTGVPGKKLVGCYCNWNYILDEPRYIDALQKKLGVNVIIGGLTFKSPDWLLEIHPQGKVFAMKQEEKAVDDSRIFKAIDETHRRGMDIWFYTGAHYHSLWDRKGIAETFDGVNFTDITPIKYACDRPHVPCKGKQINKEYEPVVFSYIAKTYDVDSIYVSHYRYANPSHWLGLFGCGCSYCQEEAAQMGYDFPRMMDSMMNLRRRLERLDRKTLEYIAKFRLNFMDFLTLLGDDDGVMDWLVFRAKVMGNQLKRVHDAIHTATNHRCGFITDTQSSTFALLSGHNWADFIGGASDALHPLSWIEDHYISPVAAWANQLCEWVDGLDESTALKVVTSFFGYDELGLPDKKIADLHVSENWQKHNSREFLDNFDHDLIIKLLTHEWTRMAGINSGRIPTHPLIAANKQRWSEKVCSELIARAEDLGLTGYIFQGTDLYIDREKL